MQSALAKICFFVFILFSLVSCTTVVHTGPPRPRPHHAMWVDGHWVPGHWAIR